MKNIFFEIHRDIPREGPGDNISTIKALNMVDNLPSQAQILDIGCGPGMQTIELARKTNGVITAIDTHIPFLNRLRENSAKNDLNDRIIVKEMSMFEMSFEKNRFDLIWSEGAIYILGFEQGLKECRNYLKSNGYLVVSELTWLRQDIPDEVKKYWKINYPGISSISTNISTIEECGYCPVAHFILPPESWLDNYYIPLEKNINSLTIQYKDDEAALSQLKEAREEIDMFRQYSDYYGYAFYIMKKLN